MSVEPAQEAPPVRWKVEARKAGYDLDRVCECDDPDPRIVGGDGWVAAPLLCNRCKRVFNGRA